MLNNKLVSIEIERAKVIEANPEFFCTEMMNFIGTTHQDWEIKDFKQYKCVFVNRPASGAVACYTIDPVTLKLSFLCHVRTKLTTI